MTTYVDVRILLISAIASGQGKTTVAAALARKLVRQGKRVRVFKVGADFIDPMLLARASGSPVYSLDLWMVGQELCQRQLTQAARAADVILIEGVMGLYDGAPSSADLANAFGVPVVAVVDAWAMAQTVGAVVQGLRDFGPVNIAGVIANRVAGVGHATMVANALRGIPLLAHLSQQSQTLPERQLGLVMPDEVADFDALLDALADALTLDDAAWNNLPLTRLVIPAAATPIDKLLCGATIAIARDAAFSFLYPANVDCLQRMGAKLSYFSPLADEPVPSDATAVYLPGGYPELHARVLASAQCWRDSIQVVHQARVPILAECGGMMAVAETLVDQSGMAWQMAGLLPGRVSIQTGLAGLGALSWESPQGQLRGHTFHYSRFETTLPPAGCTFKLGAGTRGDTVGEVIYRAGSLTASYFHSYFPSCPPAIAALLTSRTH